MTVAEKFDPAQSGTHNARRIFRYQISSALRRLQGHAVSDEDIHAARKRIRAARTALRLLRDALPIEVYHHYDHIVRDTAHPLSRVRDSRALIEALHMLLRHGDAVKYRRTFGTLDRSLRRECARIKLETLQDPRGLQLVRQRLGSLYRGAGHWPTGQHEWPVVGRGLQRVYARGRRCLARSRVHPTAASLHELRKQAKYLRYQLKFLEPLWRDPIKELAHQLHALTDQLGEHHDLAALAQKVAEDSTVFSDSTRRRVLLKLIKCSQSELQQESVSLGKLIYCEKPARFAARIGVYWHAWRN